MATFNGLPLYNMSFDENFIPSMQLAIVDFPAIEVNFMAFAKEKRKVLMAADEEKRIVFGAAMIPDLPIYREDSEGVGYYITFSKETIAQVASAFSQERHFNVMHDAAMPAKCTLLESYILSAAEGKVAPSGFELPDGTWMVKAHIDDDILWEDIKTGRYNGFSIESFFNIDFQQLMKKKNLLKRAARKVLCASVLANDAEGNELTLTFVEEELVDGIAVFVINEEGEMIPAPDGAYTIGGVAYVVTDGIIAKAVEEVPAPAEEIIEAEDTPAEEAAEDAVEEKVERDERDAKIDALEGIVADLQAQINTITEKMAEMQAFIDTLKVVEAPAVEETVLRSQKVKSDNPALKFFRK